MIASLYQRSAAPAVLAFLVRASIFTLQRRDAQNSEEEINPQGTSQIDCVNWGRKKHTAPGVIFSYPQKRLQRLRRKTLSWLAPARMFTVARLAYVREKRTANLNILEVRAASQAWIVVLFGDLWHSVGLRHGRLCCESRDEIRPTVIREIAAALA